MSFVLPHIIDAELVRGGEAEVAGQRGNQAVNQQEQPSRHLELTVTSLSGLAAQRMESSAGRQCEHQVAVGSVSISDLEGEAEVQVLSRRRQHCIIKLQTSPV